MTERIKILDVFAKILEIADGKYPDVDTVIVTGGRNSFKSYHIALIAAILMYQYKWKILYSRYTWTSATDSVIEEVKEKIDVLKLNLYVNILRDRIIKLPLNQEIKDILTYPQIVFKGIKTSSGNQTANLKSLKGFNCFILDEAEEHPSYRDWLKIKRSIRSIGKKNLSILILNPTTKEHWIYKEFFKKKGWSAGKNGIKDNIMYIHSDYRLNLSWVSKENLRDFERLKLEDPERFHHEIEGGFLNRKEGVIFKNWEFGEFDENLNYAYGLDFGFNDPDAFVRVAIDKKRKILYIEELIYQSELSSQDLIDLVKSKIKKRNDLIIADNQGLKIITQMQREGMNIWSASKGRDSILSGIKKIQNYKIIITPQSQNLANEFNNYIYGINAPIDAFNHAIDATRYIIEQKDVLW